MRDLFEAVKKKMNKTISVLLQVLNF